MAARGFIRRTLLAAPCGEFLEGHQIGYIAVHCNRGLYDGRNAAAVGARR